MKKRVLSLFMALALCLTLLPTAAFAEGADGGAASRETITVEGGQPTATGAPTEGGGQLTNTGEGEQPNSETDMRTEICCVGKPDSIGRNYDGTTDGGTIPIDLTFTDGTNEIKLKEGTDFTAKKTFDSADAGSRTVTVEITLTGETAKKYKLRAGEEKFEINGNINKAYPKLTVSLSQTTCTVGEKILPLLSVSGVQENAAVTYYYAPVNSGYLEFEGTETVPAIDENTAISESGTYYVYAKTGETTNYKEERSATVALTVTEPAAASVSKADGTDGGTYKTLPAALNAAQDGDTVKLLANHTTNWGDVEADEYATLAVVRKTLTLDLNGMTVDYLTVGEVVPDEEGGILDSYNGNLTVVDNIQGDSCGKIKNLEFVKGSLAIQGGRIGDDESSLTCNGNSGSVIISGGTVCNVTVGDGAAVTVTGGSGHCGTWQAGSAAVTVTGGAFGEVTFADPSNVQLTGGSFEKIAVSGASAVPLSARLANGYAFYSTSGAYQSAEGTELSNVQVQRHTHSINADGKCTECGAAFAASVTVRGGDASDASYYDTIDSAFTAAHKGDTVTLLADITNRGGSIFVSGGPYTLDLNGHRIDASGIDLVVGDVDNSEVLLRGELTVKDSSTGNAGYVQYLKLWNGDLTVESGSFHWIIESTPDSVGTITITGGTAETVTHCSPNVTFRLSGGTFNRISISSTCGKNVFPSDLLADGYAYANKNSGAIQNGEGYSDVSGVTVVEHKTHTWDENGVCACGVSCAHSEMNSTTGKCSVCGKLLAVASVKTSGGTVTCYRDIHEAFDAAKVSNDGTLTLLQDVTLNNEDSIYISPDSGDYRFTVDWNGHTLSGNTWRSLLTFADNTNVTLTDSSEAKTGGVCNNGNGAAVYLSIGGSNSVEITGGTYSPQVTTDERCYGTVRISGGVFKNPEGSDQSTALYDAKGGKLAALLADGVTLACDKDGHNLLDVYSNSLTGHGTFYVVAHTHTIGESTNKCACGYTCSHTAVDTDGKCTVCKKPMAAMVTKGGESRAYAALNDALSAAADGGTVKLLANAGEITISSPLKLDLNGKTAAKLTVTGDVTLASLLPEGYTFKSDSTWISDLSSTELTNVSMAKLPIKSMNYPTEMSMTYGGAGTLSVTVVKETDTGAVSFQWYKVEDGKEKAVGSETTKNQFNLAELKLPAGKHTFRFSATCDGYKKMSGDIAVTVQRANISASLITPPTAQENLTYTGQEQALIIAGSVADYGTMQYSLTENGTYSQDIPAGTDAGTYTVWYRVIGDANHNDTAPASVAVRIGQKPLTITGVTAASKPYDGTTDADISSVTFDNMTLTRGTDYTVTARFDDAGVGSGKNITATVTLMGQAAKNYVLEQSNFATTGNITKAAAPDFTKETALTIVNGHEKTYTVTLPTLPTLETPKEYGTVTYGAPTVNLSSTYYADGAKVEDGKLILPIQKNDMETTGSVGTVTVVIKSTNYEDITLTVNVNATNKLVPAGEPTLSAKTLTYGQALSAIKLSGKLHDNVNNKDVEGTFTWADGTVKPSAGSYEAAWKFTPTDGDTYAETTGTVTITVNKAKPTGEPIYTRITAANKTLKDAALKPNTSWPTGTIQWVDKDGKELPDTTEVKANTAYKWIFTPTGADADNYTTATGELTLYSVSTGGGSSSGSTVKTDTVTNPDGSVTKTETKSDGTVVETTTGKDGSVSKTTTNPTGSSVTETKAADGSTATVKTDKHGQTTAETTLSNKAVEDAKKNGEAVKAPVEVEASRDSSTAPTVKVELPKNSGDTKVEILVSNVKPGTVAVLVHADGTEEIVKNSLPTADGIQLTVNGGATVKIVDNSKDFADTRNHWAKDAIDFVSARGLVNGMSATIYAPNASTTRAQLWTILARQNDADLNGGNTWYEKAQLWSKNKGISDGTEPNAAINRAQMVTMLWRTMGQPAAGGAATFTDVPADSYYAQAVAWAVENGITTGVGGGKFDPTATCTRAQIATFLARSMK